MRVWIKRNTIKVLEEKGREVKWRDVLIIVTWISIGERKGIEVEGYGEK